MFLPLSTQKQKKLPSAQKEETHALGKDGVINMQRTLLYKDDVNMQPQRMFHHKDDVNMQTQNSLPSAQREKAHTCDNDAIINKIMGILHKNTDNTIKEITSVLPLRNKEQTDEMQRKNKEFKEQTDEMRRKNKELEKQVNEMQSKNQELKKQIKEIQSKNEELENQIEKNKLEAQKTIDRLTREASKYQAELGRTMNVLSNDFNNSCQLREDIETLKKTLEKFSLVKPAKDFDINREEVIGLLKMYKCTNFVDDVHYKSLLQAVLQRFILESMVEYIDQYFSKTNRSELEQKIVENTKTLLNNMDSFAKSRKGNDNITQNLPVRFRQQIYSVLSSRGFTSIVSPRGTTEHPFISDLQKKLIITMNKFRIVKDPNKEKIFIDMAAKLSRDVIRIFFFDLKAQEQIADSPIWFECNTRVNPDFMEGAFDPDNCQDEVVQICAFPLIGIDLNNEKKRKILSKANVLIARRKTN
ncbi:25250_t:CDS:1 [Racocetra persica]|uniref:25250_t:CDS:1 n=1 Tax=Racocetra persica TaxID=160502 RepID=A0ACA9KID3_9GLOM|nr:25250_t:CDS:1 [Racocetra persica]